MSLHLDWYAVRTEAQREDLAQRALRRIGVATYIPEHRDLARRGHTRVIVQRRTYPGYVFVGLEPGREPWIGIDECSAVIGVVGFGTPPVPARIPATAIGDLRLRQFCGLHDKARLKTGGGARLPAEDPDPAVAGRVGRVVNVISDERIVLLFGGGRSNSQAVIVSRRLDEMEWL